MVSLIQAKNGNVYTFKVRNNNMTQIKGEAKGNTLRKTKAKAMTVQFDANLALTNTSRTAVGIEPPKN